MRCLRYFLFLFLLCGTAATHCLRAQSLGGIPDPTFNLKDKGYSGYTGVYDGSQLVHEGRNDEVIILTPGVRKGLTSRYFHVRNKWSLSQSNPDGSSVWDDDSTRRLLDAYNSSLVCRDQTNQLFTVFSPNKDTVSVIRQKGQRYNPSLLPGKFRVPNHTFGIQKCGMEKRSANRYLFWITFSDDSAIYNHRTFLILLDSHMRLASQPNIISNFYCHKSSQAADGKLYLIGRKAIRNLDWAHPGTTYLGTQIIEFAPNLLQTGATYTGLDSTLIQGALQVFEVQSDGKFLMAGKLAYNFAVPEVCMRLMPDGSIDNSFTPTLVQPGTGVCWSKRKDEPVRVGWVRKTNTLHKAFEGVVAEGGGLTTTNSLDLPPDWPAGKALFYHYNRQMFLYETGDLTPFVANLGYSYDTIPSMRYRFYMGVGPKRIPMTDNYGVFGYAFGATESLPRKEKLFLNGNISLVNGQPYPYAALVNPDGSSDTSFRGIQVLPEPWKSWAVLTQGKCIRYIGDKLLLRRWQTYSTAIPFLRYDTVYRYNKDGTLDDEFLPFRSSTDFIPYKNKGYVTAFANTPLGEPIWVDAITPVQGNKLFISILDSNGNQVRVMGPIQAPAGYDSAVSSSRYSSFIGYDSRGHIWRAYFQSTNNFQQPWIKRYYSITNPETGATRFLRLDSNLVPAGMEIRVTASGHYIFIGNNYYGDGQNLKQPKWVQVDSNGHFVSNADLPEPRYLNKPDGFGERNAYLTLGRILDDGKLLVKVDAGYPRYLVRYFPDGRYDPSFLPIRNYTEYYNFQIPVLNDRLYVCSPVSPYSYEYIDQNGFTNYYSVGASRKTGLHSFLLNSAPGNVGYVQGKVEQVPSPFAGCNPAVARKPVAGRMLHLEPGNHTAFTDNNGQFTVIAPPGNYALTQTVGNNALQRQICPAPPQLEREVSLATANAVVFGQNFINQTYTCPRLGMSMAAPRFRLCSKGQIQIYYYNDGMEAEPNARVHLFLPEVVKVKSASKPFTKLADSSLVFDIGNLEPNQKGFLLIEDTVGCPHTPDSMARACFSARMEPLNLCNEVEPSQINWDGAWLDAYAQYNPTTMQVKVVVKNRGANMGDSTALAIGHSTAGFQQRRIKLLAGDSLVQNYPAAVTGSLGLWLRQTPNCPVGAEGQLFHSGTNTATSYLSFNNGWFELQTASACPPFRYSYDPNEKQVFPEGDIRPGTHLNYTIHFENYGNDTAYAVSVVDSLPAGLSLNTLVMKGSSHPCTMMLAGDTINPVITFNFRDLKLTAKREDSIRSKGYCTFVVQAKDDLPDGFELHNRAHIYFDGNPAVVTNTVTNRIPSVLTATAPLQPETSQLTVFPNPSTGLFSVRLSGGRASYVLTDLQGKKVAEGWVERQDKLNLRKLEPGMYFLLVNGYKPERLLVQP